MLPCLSVTYALASCLLHVNFATARGGITIPIPIIIDATTVHTVAFSFLIIFSIFTGILFVVALARVCGAKENLPPDVSPLKYETGRLFNWLSFLAAGLWWSQIIIYTVYVRKVFMQKERRNFPDSAYVARYTLDQLTDVFVAAGGLYLVHYRRNIHSSVVAPPSSLKKALDAFITFAHVAIVGYTTAFQHLTVSDPANDNNFLMWLTSFYVYTGVYVLVVVNVTTTMVLSSKTLKANFIVDEPCKHAIGQLPGSMIVHALFKIIVAALYSQYNNIKIDYDMLRVFEIIILCTTYLFALVGLVVAGGKNDEDVKKLKVIKELEKQEKAVHNHK